MDYKQHLEELNKQKLDKIDEYLKSKNNISAEDKLKLEEAKNNWQGAWSKYFDVLMYLESLEL